MPQKKNDVEWREFYSQTHFSVNSNMQQHGNVLTFDLVLRDNFKK
jgi:hypothetical protein